MSTARRIDIDWTACQGHGLCAELLPEHVTLDEWGYLLVDAAPVPAATVKRPGGQLPVVRFSLCR